MRATSRRTRQCRSERERARPAPGACIHAEGGGRLRRRGRFSSWQSGRAAAAACRAKAGVRLRAAAGVPPSLRRTSTDSLVDDVHTAPFVLAGARVLADGGTDRSVGGAMVLHPRGKEAAVAASVGVAMRRSPSRQSCRQGSVCVARGPLRRRDARGWRAPAARLLLAFAGELDAQRTQSWSIRTPQNGWYW
jgi:hypothetical protein